ncbi:MAG: DUF3618 domain-containing protein [Acidobacteriota bacterium]
MNHVDDLSQRSPEEIQARIAHTRKALDRKLDKLGDRLDPSARLAEVKEGVAARVDRVREKVTSRAPQIYAWGAVGAMAAGAAMAATNWRRLRRNHDQMYVSGCIADVIEPESFDDGVVSGPTIEPRT